MLKIGQGHSVFAKNSDRDPGEPQMISYCTGSEGLDTANHPEHKVSYDNRQFKTLQLASSGYASPFKALISRPSWMWGAEMGVNERGVAIGNEAVFSTSPVDKNGLLGMDILRLALHNSPTARDAVSIITQLISKYGQGGNASYKGHLTYHNSFLIYDGSQAFILETAAKRWVVREVTSSASISNAYTIGKDYQKGDEQTLLHHPDFAHRHASALHLFFTKADKRRTFISSQLSKSDESWTAMRDILISNIGSTGKPDHSMKSICLNAKGLVQSQTTASMIIEYAKGSCLVWLTGSPLPSYFPYLPFTLSASSFSTNPFANLSYCYAFAKNRTALTKTIEQAPPQILEKLADLSRNLEKEFEALVRTPFAEGNEMLLDEACKKCWERIPAYEAKVSALLFPIDKK
jgi:hypothetical protein